MSAFLFLLVKLNLAMGMAVVLVWLLRRSLRLAFGAPVAYAIWFLVPIAGMASLFPPRVAASASVPVAPVPVPTTPVPVMGHIAHFALSITGQLTGQSALVLSVSPPAPAYAWPDATLLLFTAWALGASLMTLYLARLQFHFSAAVRRGEAGPAVQGFLRPRIVTPDGFQEQFTPLEQAAILMHERIHLVRQDARINALAALLRCLCWFNPLIHLGARWLRIDQELACDATAVSGSISRRAYAKALLKSQLVVTALPLGCNWPGSQHPLIERIALLKRDPPGAARRLAGAGLVLLAATFVGLGAWAAQPPVVAEPAVARQPVMAQATLLAPDQTARDAIPNRRAADANSTGSGNDVDLSNNVRANGAISAGPAATRAPTPRTVSIEAGTESAIVALPQIASASEPMNKIIADQKSQDASPEPQEILAKNAAASPAMGDAAAAGAGTSLAAASGPRTITEAALGCLLGFGHWQCPADTATYWSWCGERYEQRWVGDCPEGPLEEVNYLGINAAGADVYEARYRHTDTTAIVEPHGPDGKAHVHFIRGNPDGIIPSSLVDVASSAAHKMTLYRGVY